MLAKRLPWWSGLEGLPFQVALHHRRLPGKFVQKIILAVTASIVFLTLIHGWGTPLDSLTSKATQIVLDHYKIPDNTQPYGENHAFVTNLEFLGIQTSNNSCSRRDLGFTGKLGDHWYAIHGDAIWCAPNQTNAMAKTNDTMFRGMVRNTISMMTDDVLKPYDLYVDDRKPVPGPRQFFEFVREWGEHLLTGFGGTSICAVDEKTGAVYYAINDLVNGMVGAGVARVELNETTLNVTVAERYGEKGIWWLANDNPRYGDISAYRDERGDYNYLLGGAPNGIQDYRNQQYVYQARVPHKEAFNLSAYEYWHGRGIGWSPKLLKTFNSETAVMWNTGQGQMYWNNYLECYLFVHTNPGSNQVNIRTASSPEGPWSDDITIYNAIVVKGGQIYAGVVHPYLDESGKTLTITYTNHPNTIEAIKVTFTKLKQVDLGGKVSYQEGKPFDQEGKARSFSDAYNVSFAANVVNEPSNSTATQSAGTNTSADSTATLASTENSGTTATSESTATSETTATVEPTATPNEDSNSAKEISIEAGSPGSRDDDYFPEPQVQLDKDES